MANTLKFKRGLLAGLPTAAEGEPLFTTDTKDLYIGTSTGNQRFQKYIASGATTQILRGDGSLYSFPLAISSPSAGQVLKYNGTSWVNDSDSGITGSGSAGQVAYFTGATTQAGNNNLFWDTTNLRLGIGTNTPISKLEVVSNSVSNYIYTTTTNTAIFSGLLIRSGGVDYMGSIGNVGTGEYRIGGFNSGGYFLTLYTNNSERARIFATGNFGINTGATDSGQRLQVIGTGYFSDSVGIGTAPSQKLDILGTSVVIGQIKSSTNTGAASYVAKNDANSTFELGMWGSTRTAFGDIASGNGYVYGTTDVVLSSATLIKFATGVTPIEYMRLTTTGRLLIGSISDSGEKLQLTGTMKVTGASYLATSATTDYVGIGVTNPATKLEVRPQNNVNFLISSAAGELISTAGTNGGVYGVINTQRGGSFRFQTDGGSGTYTEKMRLDASGNLGLGVTPSAWESVTRAFQIGNSGSLSSNTSDFRTTVGSNFFVNTSGTATYLQTAFATQYMQISGTHRWYNAPSGTAGNAITFTQAMTLDASGNLTIGTTAGSSGKLAVRGRTNIWGDDNSDATIGFSVLDNAAANYNFYVLNGGSTYTRGNVLIGNSISSGEKLQVTGTAKITGAATFSSSVTAASYRFGSFAGGDFDDYAIYVNATGATNGTTIASVANTSIRFRTNFATRLTIDGSGNMAVDTNTLFVDATNNRVGILTNTPSYGLHVQGTGYFNDNVRFPNLKGVVFVQSGGSLLGSISMDSSNQVTIDNNGFFGLSVGTSYNLLGGNTGIGTSSFGASATRTFAMLNGTAPSSSPVDSFQLYSNDVTAGNAAPHFRTENGAVIKLYQETTSVGNSIISLGGGSAVLDDTTFDGYTLRQIVKALRNQGILA